jgi:hypothetical protein
MPGRTAGVGAGRHVELMADPLLPPAFPVVLGEKIGGQVGELSGEPLPDGGVLEVGLERRHRGRGEGGEDAEAARTGADVLSADLPP